MTDTPPPEDLVERFRREALAARQLEHQFASGPAPGPGDVRVLSPAGTDVFPYVLVVDVDADLGAALVHHVSVDVEDAVRSDIILPPSATGLRMAVMIGTDLVSWAWIEELGPRFGAVDPAVIDAFADVRAGHPPSDIRTGLPLLDAHDRRWDLREDRLEVLLHATQGCVDALLGDGKDEDEDGSERTAAGGPPATEFGGRLLFLPLAAAAQTGDLPSVGPHAVGVFEGTLNDAGGGVVATIKIRVRGDAVRVLNRNGHLLVDVETGIRIPVGESRDLPAEPGTSVALVLGRLRTEQP